MLIGIFHFSSGIGDNHPHSAIGKASPQLLPRKAIPVAAHTLIISRKNSPSAKPSTVKSAKEIQPIK